MKTAVVIPAFNEEATVATVVERVRPYGDPVVIDDGSGDRTGEHALAAGAFVVTHGTNRGYDGALESGFAWAADHGYELIVTIDGDAQHDPAVLAMLVEPLRSGRAEMSLGVRANGARVSERLFSSYVRWRFGIPDILCGVKAFTTGTYRRHASEMRGPSIGTGLALAALRAGTRPELVPVAIRPRVGDTRFGSGICPNLRILRALGAAVVADLVHR